MRSAESRPSQPTVHHEGLKLIGAALLGAAVALAGREAITYVAPTPELHKRIEVLEMGQQAIVRDNVDTRDRLGMYAQDMVQVKKNTTTIYNYLFKKK